jgi:FtsZ-interacting cell division protein YlmF
VFQHLVDNRAENNSEEDEDKEEDKEVSHQQQQPQPHVQQQAHQPEPQHTASQEHTPIQIRLPLQLDFDELAGVSSYVTEIQKAATNLSDKASVRRLLLIREVHGISNGIE